ncbi:hypothetical protein GFS24_17290 [Chitinophaga sp. SYP-B3965]|uniref:hypothetical protein n=1 Tax=Chitinophaga sp. SYP-B3965 TaxID=2663120 RepID=UPI00129962D2|nr:hypothetical protein [Chitinophaga sp. SYP-B3965]MRG46879.1 hypothetical protein [Chitinophaga sp. SYP-B3965]
MKKLSKDFSFNYQINNTIYIIYGSYFSEPDADWINKDAVQDMFKVKFRVQGSDLPEIFTDLNPVYIREVDNIWFTGNIVNQRFDPIRNSFLDDLKDVIIERYKADEKKVK